MPREDRRDVPGSGPVDPWSREAPEEPEPDWAEQIRASRKARGERLKDLFATFDRPGPVDDALGNHRGGAEGDRDGAEADEEDDRQR
jgi:hypothetical protein